MGDEEKTEQQTTDELTEFLSSSGDFTVHLNAFNRLKESLQRAEDRLELAMDGAELAIWDYDLQTRNAFISPSRAAMLGYSHADLEPHLESWGRLVHPDDIERVTEVFFAHAEGHTRIFECEHRLRCKSGEYKWILARAKVVERDEHGNPKRVVGVSFDVSERRLATEKLKEYAERLEVMVGARTIELAETNRQLRKEIAERERMHEESQRLITELQKALSEVKTLGGLLPICASCKKIRDDQGYWRRVEEYIKDHSDAEFTHSMCPECTKRLYPEMHYTNR